VAELVESELRDGMVDDMMFLPDALPDNIFRDPGDDLMIDVMAREEEAEIDALLEAWSQEDTRQDHAITDSVVAPDSPRFSDGEDYDSLFADFLNSEDMSQDAAWSQEMEML
jgi:hypothetical protein